MKYFKNMKYKEDKKILFENVQIDQSIMRVL